MKPMCKQVSGDFDVHVMLQRHFYPAGFAVYITLGGTTKGKKEMSKIADVFKGFDHWMKNYNHHGASHSESLRDFITCDSCIVESGVSYDEYVALELLVKDNKYSIEWVVPYETFGELVAENKAQQARMRAER